MRAYDLTVTGSLIVSGSTTLTGDISYDDLTATGNIVTTGANKVISGSSTSTGSFGMLGVNRANPTAPIHIYQDNAYTAVAPTAGILIEQDGTGDAVLQFLLTGVKRWNMGIDNSDSDKFKITHGVSDLGEADVFTIDTAGAVGTAAGAAAVTAVADWLRNEKKSGLHTKEAVQYEKVHTLPGFGCGHVQLAPRKLTGCSPLGGVRRARRSALSTSRAPSSLMRSPARGTRASSPRRRPSRRGRSALGFSWRRRRQP